MDNYKKLLRKFILLSLIIGTLFVPAHQAQSSDLLKCLGAEELILHKKKLTGPLYYLNQHFINELSSWGHIRMKKEILNDVCTGDEFSPSVNLLRHFLLEGGSVFTTNAGRFNYSERALQQSLIDALIEKVPSVFFSYLSSLQALAEDPHCLNKKVPELNYFILKFKYLEEEIETKNVLSEKSKVKSIFDKIKRLDSIIWECKVKKTSNKIEE